MFISWLICPDSVWGKYGAIWGWIGELSSQRHFLSLLLEGHFLSTQLLGFSKVTLPNSCVGHPAATPRLKHIVKDKITYIWVTCRWMPPGCQQGTDCTLVLSVQLPPQVRTWFTASRGPCMAVQLNPEVQAPQPTIIYCSAVLRSQLRCLWTALRVNCRANVL